MSPSLIRIFALLCLLPPLLAAGQTPPAGHLERIRESGTIRVCIWPDYYGISYRNPKTQQLTGIDVELAQELGKDIGATVEFVESSFARLIDDVTTDRCDIAMFAIGIIPSRQARLRFTSPHLQSDIYAITTRSNRQIRRWEDIDLPGVVVAVAKGTLHEPIMRERLAQAELLVLDTPFAREQEVESGRADCFMTDFPYSRRMLQTTDWARRIDPPQSFHITPYAWAMQPGDDPWYERVEAFVRAVKSDGRLRRAAELNGLEPILVAE